MPYETIRFRVTGSDPQIFSLPVMISPSGSGNASFTFTSSASSSTAAVDIVQAFYDEKNLASNQVEAIFTPTSFTSTWGYSFFTQSNYTPAQNNNSLYQTPGNILTFYYGDSGAGAQQDTSIQVGDYVYTQFTYNGTTVGPFFAEVIEVGNLSPPTVVHHFWYYSIKIPGAAQQIYYPGANSGGKSGAVTSYSVTPASVFPAAGSLAAGNPQLVLTPASQTNPAASSITVNLAISGISFTQTAYVPLLEGTSGTIYITDNTGSAGFTLPVLPNAATLDPNAAASLMVLSGVDNSSYLNRLSVGFQSGGQTTTYRGNVPVITQTPNYYTLSYNGAAADPNIASTQLAVTFNEYAWYNPLTKKFDLYTVSSQGGGAKTQVQINWLVMPAIASVTPATLPGDGAVHAVTVTLAKPLPPVQSSVNAIFTGSGGLTVQGSQANTLSNGFVTGWTVNVKTSVTSGSVQASLSLNASDTLTYLSGANFVTNLVTYINGVIATITI